MSQPIAPFHVFIIKLRLFLQTLKRTTVYSAPDFYIYKEAECFAFHIHALLCFARNHSFHDRSLHHVSKTRPSARSTRRPHLRRRRRWGGAMWRIPHIVLSAICERAKSANDLLFTLADFSSVYPYTCK